MYLRQKYTFWGRNRNKTDYLEDRCHILVLLTDDCYLFCLEATLLFSYSLWWCDFGFGFAIFLTSFMPFGSIYRWDTARRAVCVIALSVKQLNPLLQHLLSHPHTPIRMQHLISCCLACELCVCFYVFCQHLLITGWSFFTYRDIQSSHLLAVLLW